MALAVAVALFVGFGLTFYLLGDGRQLAASHTGAWAAWPALGGPDPDPYTRAYITRAGQLQLGKSEGIEFVAYGDDGGTHFDPHCTYLVHGLTPTASFWTLSAIAADGRIVVAKGTPLYLDSQHIPREDDGTMDIRVGPDLAPGNWLQTDGQNGYHLSLKLYDSAVFSGLGSDVSAMPTIARVSCP